MHNITQMKTQTEPASAPAVADSRSFVEHIEAIAAGFREYGLQIAVLIAVTAFGVCLWVYPSAAIVPLVTTTLLAIASVVAQIKPAMPASAHAIQHGTQPRQAPVGPGWTRRADHPDPPSNPQA